MEISKPQELLQTIVTKAWENQSFKEELIANPIDAIEQVTGERINLPEGKKLIVKDQTDESIVYINIPAKLNLDDVELNEEQLEVVAGGGLFSWAEHVYIMLTQGGSINN